jgi:hypothetical protein
MARNNRKDMRTLKDVRNYKKINPKWTTKMLAELQRLKEGGNNDR